MIQKNPIFTWMSKYQTDFHPTLYVEKAQQDAMIERAEGWGQSFPWSEASPLAVFLNGGILTEPHLEATAAQNNLSVPQTENCEGSDSSSVAVIRVQILIFLPKLFFGKEKKGILGTEQCQRNFS